VAALERPADASCSLSRVVSLDLPGQTKQLIKKSLCFYFDGDLLRSGVHSPGLLVMIRFIHTGEEAWLISIKTVCGSCGGGVSAAVLE